MLSLIRDTVSYPAPSTKTRSKADALLRLAQKGPFHARARQLLDTIQFANSIAAGWPLQVAVPGPATR